MIVLSDVLFVPSEAFSFLLQYVGQYAGFGVGLAICFWLLGYIVAFIVDVMKGG